MSVSKPKTEVKKVPAKITIIDSGPVHICEMCFALLKVPDECTEEYETQEVEDGEPYKVFNAAFICPLCGEKNVFIEEEIEEESPEKEKEKKKKSSRS